MRTDHQLSSSRPPGVCGLLNRFRAACRILNIMEAVGNTMVDEQGSYTLVAPAIAVSVVNVVPGQFDSLTFSVSSDGTGMKPEVSRATIWP